MNRIYSKGSFGSVLLAHNNDYGFDPFSCATKEPVERGSVTFAVPYFESKETINRVIAELLNSLRFLKKIDNSKTEILIIDDGSQNFPVQNVLAKDYLLSVTIIRHKRNQGRGAARNTAIYASRMAWIIFIDSDVLVNSEIISGHLNIQAKAEKESMNVITASLFNFVEYSQVFFKSRRHLESLFRKTNDFRMECVYAPSWIGCENDRQFIGKRFSLLAQTDNFRKWDANGFIGPWVIANMVLGGVFGIKTELARAVGGCSQLFKEYGFEETSLVTKLVVLHEAYVVPILTGFAIHMEEAEPGPIRQEKNALFRQAHRLFFEDFLHRNSKHM